MSKYNLTDILNEYVGGGRIGTLEISFKELSDKMDDLEQSGKVIVRRLAGPSGDGKVNREFEVVAMEDAVPGGKKQEKGFTVYDYKFGFDPGADEKAFEEYPFSVGGSNLALAMELIDGVKPLGLEENKMSPDEEIKNIKRMNPKANEKSLKKIAKMGKKKISEIDIDSVSNDPGSGDADNPTGEELEAGSGYDAVEEDIVEEGVVKKLRTLLKNKGSEKQIDTYLKSLNNDIRLNGFDDYEDFDDDDWVEDYEEYFNDKMDINEAVAEEESVANYLMDHYRNPNKPEETMVDEKIVGEYFNTHPDWDMIWGKSYKDGLVDFEEFFDANYSYMFDDARDLDEDLKKHFKRFM